MGAWLRATRRICCLSVSIADDSPSNTVSGMAGFAVSFFSCSADWTRLRNRISCNGLEIKSKAPFFRASTAISILPWAVIMATGKCGTVACIWSTSSSPLPSGIFMSVRQRSNSSLSSNFLALVSLAAVTTSRPICSSVMVRSSLMSGSSSTTSTRFFIMIEASVIPGRDAKTQFGSVCFLAPLQNN